MRGTRILLIMILINCINSFYSKDYKKCRIAGEKYFDLGSAKVQRVPDYSVSFQIPERTKTTLELNFTNLEFIYDEYIGAGGSGQVYRVEDFDTGDFRVLKRFFKEDIEAFQQQNFIMSLMEYDIKWHKEDNDPNKSTIASYPFKQSLVLRELQIQNDNQIPVILYKICRQLEKTHKKGILHHDIKMGNILIKSTGESLRTIDVQLIDWNLAAFYYRGYESNLKRGTVCYYPPQALLRTIFITPAADIWALAVVYFIFLVDKKPFTVSCKQSNIQAILSLVGSKRFLQVYEKYNKVSSAQFTLIQQIKENPQLFEGFALQDRIPSQAEYFDQQMVDLFQKMLQVDPQYRLTIQEVLNHPYFDRVRRLPKMYEQKMKQKVKAYQQDKNKNSEKDKLHKKNKGQGEKMK